MFSFEYGWDLDKFLNTSMHEIAWRLISINKRKNMDRKFTASLYGLELKGAEDFNKNEKEISISDEQVKRAMESAHARRQLNG